MNAHGSEMKRLKYRKSSANDLREEVEREGHHYADALPEDAMLMSRMGVANGYDFLRYGERWDREGLDPGNPIIQISKEGVQLLVLSDDQRAWIAAVESDPKRWERRKQICRTRNFVLWHDLTPANREFLLSLHWVPAEPYTAMEVLAIMAKGDDK